MNKELIKEFVEIMYQEAFNDFNVIKNDNSAVMSHDVVIYLISKKLVKKAPNTENVNLMIIDGKVMNIFEIVERLEINKNKNIYRGKLSYYRKLLK